MQLFRLLPLCLVALATVMLPTRPAHATLNLAVSLGAGGEVSPDRQYEATNLMVAPGIGFIDDILRVELGFVGSFAAVRAHDSNALDLELRPMLVINPPIIPLYGRIVLAGVNLFSPNRTLAYGAALGVGVSAFGLGLFAELGVLPRVMQTTTSSSYFAWLLEGRAGVSLQF